MQLLISYNFNFVILQTSIICRLSHASLSIASILLDHLPCFHVLSIGLLFILHKSLIMPTVTKLVFGLTAHPKSLTPIALPSPHQSTIYANFTCLSPILTHFCRVHCIPIAMPCFALEFLHIWLLLLWHILWCAIRMCMHRSRHLKPKMLTNKWVVALASKRLGLL